VQKSTHKQQTPWKMHKVLNIIITKSNGEGISGALGIGEKLA
jgi:hypothetical protein